MSFNLSTLTAAKGSKLEMFFKDMDRHQLLPVDKNGRIYIDRDPRYFTTLMNYIANNGNMGLPENAFEKYMFLEEKKYWRVDEHTQYAEDDIDGRTMAKKLKTFRTL